MQRIVAQVIITATNVLAKAFMQAYAQAKAGGGAAARQTAGAVAMGARMDAFQARHILNIESRAPSRDEVLRQFQKYYGANDPEKGGSFYLQSKIHNAKEVLLDDMKANAASAAAAEARKGAASASSASSSEKPLR